MHLFQAGNFELHSGATSRFKIECDALSFHDWVGLSVMLQEFLPPFGSVEGVPRGGVFLAAMLQQHATEGPLLIVDDVWTTGDSMVLHRNGRDAIGAVVFARGPVPSWVTALFSMPTHSGHQRLTRPS